MTKVAVYMEIVLITLNYVGSQTKPKSFKYYPTLSIPDFKALQTFMHITSCTNCQVRGLINK